MCHFLYGSETSDPLTSQMQKALDEQREFKTEIILYKKSGKPADGWRILSSLIMFDTGSVSQKYFLIEAVQFQFLVFNRLQVPVSAGYRAHKEREE